MLYSILVSIDVLLAIAIVGLVLIQHGKGADMGAAFGSGASGTVFGARGSASFLTKLTAILAVLFFVVSLWLAHLASNRSAMESVIDSNAIEETAVEQPNLGVTISEDIPAAGSESEEMETEAPEADQTMESQEAVEVPKDVPDVSTEQPGASSESTSGGAPRSTASDGTGAAVNTPKGAAALDDVPE